MLLLLLLLMLLQKDASIFFLSTICKHVRSCVFSTRIRSASGEKIAKVWKKMNDVKIKFEEIVYLRYLCSISEKTNAIFLCKLPLAISFLSSFFFFFLCSLHCATWCYSCSIHIQFCCCRVFFFHLKDNSRCDYENFVRNRFTWIQKRKRCEKELMVSLELVMPKNSSHNSLVMA